MLERLQLLDEIGNVEEDFDELLISDEVMTADVETQRYQDATYNYAAVMMAEMRMADIEPAVPP